MRKPRTFKLGPYIVTFGGARTRDTFSAAPSLVPNRAGIRGRQTSRKAKIEHNFWKSQRNPDELCDDILDFPTVKATWGSLRAEILEGGIWWVPPAGEETNPKAKDAAELLNAHDELTSADERPLTMEGSARAILQAVPRGFGLLERRFAPINNPVRTGKWAGTRRLEAIIWLSRAIVDVEEDPWGFLLKFTEKKASGVSHSRDDVDWHQYVPVTWDEDSEAALLFGNGLCIPTYEFYMHAKSARQYWRSIVERTGSGAVVMTLDENSSAEFDEIADKALEMLDNLLVNFTAVLPKGADLSARDLLAKNSGDVFKALDEVENAAIQLLWVYQVASTGTDEGGANSRARTEALQEEKSSRAQQIVRWLSPQMRRLWRPLITLNLGNDAPMPVPLFAGEALAAKVKAGQAAAPDGEGGDSGASAAPLVGTVQAVREAIVLVSSGQIAPESAKAFARFASPGIDKQTVDGMIDSAANFTQRAIVEPAPARAAFSARQPLIAPEVREMVRRAATRKIRQWFEAERDVDCSRPLPLRAEFRAAYERLGLGRGAADAEAQATCDFFARRLGEVLPGARTIGGKLRVLGHVAEELAEEERLAGIQERRA